MKARSIRNQLAVYTMVSKRKTTINHMFASAIAPVDPYLEAQVQEGLGMLGQDAEADLLCVYCDEPAETWDHLRALVQDRQFSGYGHQLGNLVPSCKSCNSRKGNKTYDAYIRMSAITAEDAARRIATIAAYSAHFIPNPLPQGEYARRWPDEMAELDSIRDQIISLMARADDLAAALRGKARVQSEGHVDARDGGFASG